MKKNKLLLITVLLLSSYHLKAQNLKWNPVVKVADRIHQTYLGYDGKYQYSLGSNIKMTHDDRDSLYPDPNWKKLKFTLFRYDDKFTLKDTLPLRFFSTPKRYFEANKLDANIRLFYTKGISSTLTFSVDMFDLTGKFLETKNLCSVENLAKFQLRNYYQWILSPAKKAFTVVSTDSVCCFNAACEPVWKIALNNKFKSGYTTDENRFYGVMIINKVAVAVSIDDKGTLVTQPLKTDKAENSSYFIKMNNDKVYVASLYGYTDKTFNQDYDKAGNVPRFKSNGLQVNIFDNKLENQKTVYVPYSEQTLLDAVERLLIQNIKGIDWAGISQVDFTEDGDLVALLSKTYSEPTAAKPVQGSKVELEGRMNHCQQLIVLKTNDEGKNYQSVIKRNTEGEEAFEYVMNIKGIPNKTDYYIYYQNGRSETDYTLQEVVLNNTLRTIYTKDVNLIDNKKPFLDLSTITRVDKNNFIVFGRILKKTGSGLLEFK